MIWPSLVCRQSSNLGSGWKYPREDVKREEWWVECGKPKCERQKEEVSQRNKGHGWRGRRRMESEHNGREVKAAELNKAARPIGLNKTKDVERKARTMLTVCTVVPRLPWLSLSMVSVIHSEPGSKNSK